jgi:acetylornithine deacetylase/succinyl-diaminopimelate desuccinylase-like protein
MQEGMKSCVPAQNVRMRRNKGGRKNMVKKLIDAAIGKLSKENAIQVTRELIDIPSPMGGEKAIANYIAERFRQAGLKVIMQEVEPNRPNVIGILKGTGGGASLMFCGHMDTTWAGDEEGIKELGPGYWPKSYMDGDWIYGVGGYNMKCGLASTILAIESLAKAKVSLKGDLLVACVVGETCQTQVGRFQGARYRGSGVGGGFMVSIGGITADMAVCPESTSGRISIASGGYVYLEIRILGNPGATYARGGGMEVKPAVDAFEKMLELIPKIKEWAKGYRASHKYKGEEATNVAIIACEAGHPWHPTKVSPYCRLYLEVDTMPGQHPLDIIRDVEGLLSKARSQDPDLAVDLNVVQATHGAEISEDEYLVKALSKAHKEVYKAEAQITFDAWFCDTTALTRHGIPSLCYHTAGRSQFGGSGHYPKEGEHSHVDDILESARVYIHLAGDVCSKDRQEVLANRPPHRGTVTL